MKRGLFNPLSFCPFIAEPNQAKTLYLLKLFILINKKNENSELLFLSNKTTAPIIYL